MTAASMVKLPLYEVLMSASPLHIQVLKTAPVAVLYFENTFSKLESQENTDPLQKR